MASKVNLVTGDKAFCLTCTIQNLSKANDPMMCDGDCGKDFGLTLGHRNLFTYRNTSKAMRNQIFTMTCFMKLNIRPSDKDKDQK